MGYSEVRKQASVVIECYLFYYNCNPTDLVYAYCRHDAPVTLLIDGEEITFYPGSIARSPIKRTSGEQYDSMTLSALVVASSDESSPLTQLASQAIAEGLSLKIYTVYSDGFKAVYEPKDYVGPDYWQSVSARRRENTLEVDFASATFALQSNLPRVFFQRTCNWSVYDCHTCKLDKGAWVVNGTITAINSTRTGITVSIGSAKAANWFRGGFGEFHYSVPGEGTSTYSLSSKISINDDPSSTDTRALTLLARLPLTMGIGSAVSLYPGCDKTFQTCNTKFANTDNFMGFPLIRVRDNARDDIR